MILVEVSDATKANTSMQMQASDPMPCTNPLTELKAAESTAGLVPGSICGGGCLLWLMQEAIDAVSMMSVGQMLCLACAWCLALLRLEGAALSWLERVRVTGLPFTDGCWDPTLAPSVGAPSVDATIELGAPSVAPVTRRLSQSLVSTFTCILHGRISQTGISAFWIVWYSHWSWQIAHTATPIMWCNARPS